jgi:hypothetical protein
MNDLIDYGDRGQIHQAEIFYAAIWWNRVRLNKTPLELNHTGESNETLGDQ